MSSISGSHPADEVQDQGGSEKLIAFTESWKEDLGSCRNTDAESISEQEGGLAPDELHVVLWKICCAL